MTFFNRGNYPFLFGFILTIAGLVRGDGTLLTLSFLVVILFGFTRWKALTLPSCLQLSLQGPETTFAHRTPTATLFLHNSSCFFPICQLQIELAFPEASFRPELGPDPLFLAPGDQRRLTISFSPGKRGFQSQAEITLTGSFLPGFPRFRRQLLHPFPILIYPRPILPLELQQDGSEEDSSEQWSRLTQTFTPGEPQGLRPFRPGDTASRFHWPATLRAQARGRQPRVYESAPPSQHLDQVHVLFHSFGTDHTLIREDFFERALSLLTGTLRSLRQEGLQIILRADFDHWKPRFLSTSEDWQEVLTLLARAQRAPGTQAHELQSLLRKPSSEVLTILLSDLPVESWQHLLPEERPDLLPVDIRQHRYGFTPLRKAHSPLIPHL